MSAPVNRAAPEAGLQELAEWIREQSEAFPIGERLRVFNLLTECSKRSIEIACQRLGNVVDVGARGK